MSKKHANRILFKHLWYDHNGRGLETKPVRFPAYLIPKLREIAVQLHEEAMQRGEIF